jgi:hypothetical protein
MNICLYLVEPIHVYSRLYLVEPIHVRHFTTLSSSGTTESTKKTENSLTKTVQLLIKLTF